MISIAGIAAILFLTLFTFQVGWKLALVNPYFWVCIAYARFFGFRVDDPNAFEIDIAVTFSFAVFSFAYFFSYRWIEQHNPYILFRLYNNAPPAIDSSNLRLYVMASFSLILFLVVLYRNYLICGSLSKAPVLFYHSHLLVPPTEIGRFLVPWLLRPIYLLMLLSVVGLFELRRTVAIGARPKAATIFYIAVALFCMAIIMRGARNMLVAPIFAMILADLIWGRKKGLAASIASWSAVAIVIIPVAVMLGMLRLQQFESVQDLIYRAMTDTDRIWDEGMDNLLVQSHMGIGNWIGYCFRRFNSSNFLWFHSYFTILTFPIPRELWPSKPLGFGQIVAVWGTGCAPGANSVAAGLAGEGWATGGVIGIVMLSLSIGWVTGICGVLGVKGLRSPLLAHRFVGLIAWVAPSNFVRGDMLAAFAQSIFPLLVVLAVVWVLGRRRLRN